jgi:hypothetical protein
MNDKDEMSSKDEWKSTLEKIGMCDACKKAVAIALGKLDVHELEAENARLVKAH